MDVEIVGRILSTLPADDDHPYRTGPWRPQTTRVATPTTCAVIGELPADLDGVYLRNTENPVHPAIGRYHPFDGDGMMHVVGFRDGKAFYRNRFVRTDGFARRATRPAGRCGPGMAEPAQTGQARRRLGRARPDEGRRRAPTSSCTRGVALTSFYQCGDLYRLDPFTLDDAGQGRPGTAHFPIDVGRLRAPEGRRAHRRAAVLQLLQPRRRTCTTASSTRATELAHYVDVPLPGPRLPHDMAFTENYAILNDFPLFWDPELLAQGRARCRGSTPTCRRASRCMPRRGGTGDIRWFEADPTYVLHLDQRLRGRRRDRARRILPGRPAAADTGRHDQCGQTVPLPGTGPAAGPAAPLAVQPGHRRSQRGATVGRSHHRVRHDQPAATPAGDYRYTYAATGKPGWFLFDGLVKHDLRTGGEQRYHFADGVFGSEAAMAPRLGSTGEDDGYLITLTTDMDADAPTA